MDITQAVSRYIQNKGIKLSYIKEKTGIPKNAVYFSLAKNGTRKLRVDEFFLICDAIGADPLLLSGCKKRKKEEYL